jgi:glycosyltransferase involved in cell wall biosynthesis
MNENLLAINKVIIYGAGMVGDLVRRYYEINEVSGNIVSFAVTKKEGDNQFRGYRCTCIENLKMHAQDCYVIIATFPGPQDDMETHLKTLGFDKIIRVDFELYRLMSNTYIENFLRDKVLGSSYDILYMASDNNRTSGAFLCLVDIVKDMNRKGLQTLVVLPEYGNGEELLEEMQIDYTYVPSTTWLKKNAGEELTWQEKIRPDNEYAIRTIQKIIEQCSVKLVHCNTTYTNVGAMAAYNSGIPVVWHLREKISEQGYGYEDANYFYQTINNANKIVVVSEFLAQCYPKLNDEKKVIVYDGVDVERFFAKRRVLDNLIVNIIMPAAIYPLKRQEDLVKAAKILKHKGIKYHIDFIGNGEKQYIEKLKSIIKINDLKDNIDFVGEKSDIENCYKKADIVISCSGVESFGRVCVEGLLSGCLVIGANSGGTIELLRDRGILFEYQNSDELALKIEYAIEHKEEMRKVAENGQNYAKNRFSKEICSKKIYEIYQELMR